MALTVTDFRQQFPTQFPSADYTDSVIERALEEAVELHNRLERITLYCAAHLLVLGKDIADGTERPGEVTETKVGPITTKHVALAGISFHDAAAAGRRAFFTRTEYGKMVLALESRSIRSRLAGLVR